MDVVVDDPIADTRAHIVRPSQSRSFDDMVTCVVINLETRPDRWRNLKLFCRIQNIHPVRFAAHDREQGRAAFPDSLLAPSELGLWSSFLGVVRSDVGTDWLLVLEDDAFLLPRFRHHVMTEIHRAPSSVAAIRIAWIGRLQWDRGMPFWRYVIRLPKRLGEKMHDRWQRRGAGDHRVSVKKFYGTHALLIRRDGADQIIELLKPARDPLDVAFTHAEQTAPDVFVRSKKSRAWQWPNRSDIRDDRTERHRSTNTSGTAASDAS